MDEFIKEHWWKPVAIFFVIGLFTGFESALEMLIVGVFCLVSGWIALLTSLQVLGSKGLSAPISGLLSVFAGYGGALVGNQVFEAVMR